MACGDNAKVAYQRERADAAVQQVYGLEMQVADLQHRNDNQRETIEAFVAARNSFESTLQRLALDL